jgi:hypothetical protein
MTAGERLMEKRRKGNRANETGGEMLEDIIYATFEM